MSLGKLEPLLVKSIEELAAQQPLKGNELVISGIKAAQAGCGPRCYLAGHGSREFLRMNSNSYLGLSLHPEVIAAEEHAARLYGCGPGAVRFISGTYQPHIDLEHKLAAFHKQEAAMLFSAAYATVVGVLPALISPTTVVISDALNHNSIINALRLARPTAKAIYGHLDLEGLDHALAANSTSSNRALVITDGIFSMRGDHAPLDKIAAICANYEAHYQEGVVLVVDDSHGIGACGRTGRGTEELCNCRADILIGTLGKAFGVNGGYVASAKSVIGYLREKAPLYIYSNPISPAEAAAALQALQIVDSQPGKKLLGRLQGLTRRFESGLGKLGLETIAGDHPIVPLLVRDTNQTTALCAHLFNHGILATGLNFPVVPKGDEEIRFQVNASHTEQDLDYVLRVLASFQEATT